MSRFFYLTLGYGLIWVSIGVYLVLMQRRIDRVRGELAELRARLGRN
ncbi:MAG: CcmD family protein [Candidatus Eisenbacteria bacterium]|nr:CcmD family protein [Candidatus Eisenbacteria bacterium]MCC7143076.1 CcmD family protein [Candidatus Eisenbacteria bacterium]